MKIYCDYGKDSMPATKQVNRVGKYLKKHLDGAFKYEQHANECDVYVTLLYQLKPELGGEVNDVHEMTIDINITTYQNKLRVNTIEVTPKARTLGFDLIKPDELINLEKGKELIIWIVGNRIRKAYKDYLILF